MAINTETKRRSVSAYFGNRIFPLPDGTVDKVDRTHTAWLFSLDAQLLLSMIYVAVDLTDHYVARRFTDDC